ncbi:hypothetical protein ASPWEDRAFT_184012 [Aspergillus wentii DTO 134E9]|uniref:Uncharacterized protein n=1 Tax=Aspergillus wentii DTO 134E9 TaxID=1073089 RepID=A0A1L9RM56_ASPWE|nr:uncharacterized protein ASPWEDRAFT_184012 [Aspergillus wentii DTO 134E9]KAI9929517.1 hypothetical protein MW887_000990 [Aspergillus wentii]OJJ36040.1 hypothetical protein ASPWEDRAFT_184012 [Aspergillus wentii DTO 134E9]
MYQRVYTNDSDVLILGLYFVFILYQLVNRKSYHPHPALPYHTVAGLAELALYYGGYPCSLPAVAACLVHSATSWMLVKHLKKGYPPITKPSYQASGLMRPLVILHAYHTQEPMAYHDVIMPLHAFIYMRAFLFLFSTMGPTRDFIKNMNSRFVYALGITGSGAMAFGHCSSSWAGVAYFILVHLVGKFSLWTRRIYDSYIYAKKPVPEYILFCRRIGAFIFDIPTENEMQAAVADGPKIGYLPMDRLGHDWAAFN